MPEWNSNFTKWLKMLLISRNTWFHSFTVTYTQLFHQANMTDHVAEKQHTTPTKTIGLYWCRGICVLQRQSRCHVNSLIHIRLSLLAYFCREEFSFDLPSVTVVRLTNGTRHRTRTSTRWHVAFALCCHSNETRAPTANRPNSAQLEGTPATPWSYIRVRAVVWECGPGQTDRHTYRRAWPMYISCHLRLMRNVTRSAGHGSPGQQCWLGRVTDNTRIDCSIVCNKQHLYGCGLRLKCYFHPWFITA